MASQDVEVTSSGLVLINMTNITESSNSEMPLIGCIDVEPVHFHSIILPLWVANLFSSVTSKIHQLDYAVRLAQLNQCPLDEDYPSLISQY